MKVKPTYAAGSVFLSIVLLSGCSADSSETILMAASSSAKSTEALPQGAQEQSIDISYAIFHERSADCAVYDNSYLSSVEDEQRNQGFEGAVTISSDDSGCTITANSIPNHNFNDSSANFHDPVKANAATYHVTRTPAVATKKTALSQRVNNGVMLNGVVLDILSAGCYKPDGRRADANGNVQIGCNTNDAWLLDPLSTNTSFGADKHNAHTQPNGLYHYHGNPNALFDDNPGPAGSPVVGFAADGFPIYGSYFLDSTSGSVRKATSGYTLKPGTRGNKSDTNPGGSYDGTYVDDWQFAGAGDLDECNGMRVDGQYGYYVTDTYPWVIKCFTGTPDASFEKKRGRPPQGNRPAGPKPAE